MINPTYIGFEEGLAFSLVVINRQTSYDFDILREATESYEVCQSGHQLVVHLPERTETGLITASTQAVRAVHICNSWFYSRLTCLFVCLLSVNFMILFLF